MATPKSEADRALAEFWRGYVESGRTVFGYLASSPLEALRALAAIQRLPFIYPPAQTDTPGGREVQRVIEQKGPLGLPVRWWGFAAFSVQEASLDSPEAKRLRYNLRLAQAEGIVCRLVEPAEKQSLLDLANNRERRHPDPAYRVTDPDNEDLLDHDLWVVVEGQADQPLLIAVAAIDGEFAALRYFRTLGDGEQHSLSRYLAHHTMVEALAARGVRWLIDNTPPAAQTNGVRLFQRIVGYRHARIRRPGRRKSVVG